MPRKTLHDISVQFITETPKALLYNDGKQKFWIPKSITGDDGIVQLEDNRDGSTTLTAPEWWLNERGLI